jgi:phosphatidylinositol 4-kinase
MSHPSLGGPTTAESSSSPSLLLDQTGSLLRMFKSEAFDAHLHVSYLFKMRDNQGVQDYLTNELYSMAEKEVDFYLPELCLLALSRPNHEKLHAFLLDKAASRMYYAVKIHWMFQSAVEAPALSSELLENAMKLYQESEMAVVNSRVFSSRVVELRSRSSLSSAPVSPSVSAAIRSSSLTDLSPLRSLSRQVTVRAMERKFFESPLHFRMYSELGDAIPTSTVHWRGGALDVLISSSSSPRNSSPFASSVNELDLFMLKQLRCDSFNSLNNFVAQLTRLSTHLVSACTSQEERRKSLCLAMAQTNHWLLDRRIAVALSGGETYMTGLSLPVPWPTTEFTHIIKVHVEDCKVFRTRQRAPFAISLEVVDFSDLDTFNGQALAGYVLSEFALLVNEEGPDLGDGEGTHLVDGEGTHLDNEEGTHLVNEEGTHSVNEEGTHSVDGEGITIKTHLVEENSGEEEKSGTIKTVLGKDGAGEESGRNKTDLVKSPEEGNGDGITINTHLVEENSGEEEKGSFNLLDGEGITIKTHIEKLARLVETLSPDKFTNMVYPDWLLLNGGRRASLPRIEAVGVVVVPAAAPSSEVIIVDDSAVTVVNARKIQRRATLELRRKVWGELNEDRIESIRSESVYGHLPSWRLQRVIVKGGDDVRQEVLAGQLVSIFQKIFHSARLPLWLRPYEVVVTSASSGLIEMIPNTVSIDSLKKEFGGSTALNEIFSQVFADHVEEAQLNFIESCAAYSVVCYLLQVKDRHNGNLLLDSEGHLIHIDFGFMLSNAPGGSFALETSPFKLTQEYLDVMGGEYSHHFETFRTLIIRAFLEARKHRDRICHLVRIVGECNPKLGCFSGGGINGVEGAVNAMSERFYGSLTEEACIEKIVSLIDESINNWRTIQYDNYQRITNGIL